MPDAVVIGKVAVKVIPDTSAFRAKAKAELEKVEKKLKVKVKLVPDEADLKTKVKATMKRVEKEIGALKIKVDLGDEASLRAAITKLEAELKAMDAVTIEVDLDRDSIEAELAKLRTQLKAVERFELKVDPKSETSIRAAIARIHGELAKRTELKVRLKTDTASLKTAAADLERRLADVARINLKIDPTSEGSLQAALKKLDTEIAAHRAVMQIDTKTDLKSLEATRRQIQAMLDRAGRLKVEADNAKLRATLHRVDQAFSALRIQIRPGIDEHELRRTEDEIKRSLEEIDDLQFSIKPEMSEREKRKVYRQIDELKHKINNLKANIEPNIEEHAKLAVQTRLALLARDRVVKIVPQISKAAAAKTATALAALSGGRSLKNFLNPFKTLLTNLDKAIPLISAVGLGIVGIGGWAATASANLFALASSLASIGGAALALPGILGGIAVGMTVTIVALKDFKKYVPEVSAAWSKIKKTISENFWAKAQKPIRSMIDKLLPEFVQGFSGVSTAIGGFFGKLATDIGDKFDGPVKGMFANLTKSVHIFSGATSSISDIIVRLGRTGASYLPRLATFFKGALGRFDDFLTRADKDGSLKRWINNGIQALKDLGGVIKNVYTIFRGLSKAMTDAGGSTLSVFRATLKKISDVVNSPGFQKGLVGVFRAAFEAMNLIGKIAGPAVKQMFTALGKTLQTVLPIAGEAIGDLADAFASLIGSPDVQNGLKALFSGIASGIKSMTPAIKNLAPLFGAMGKFIGNFAKDLGPVLAAAFDALGPPLTELLTGLTPVVDLLTGALAQAIKDIAPSLVPLAQGFVAFIKPLAEQLGPVMKTVAPAFASFLASFGDTLGQLGPVLAPLLPKLGTMVAQLLQMAADVLPDLVPLFKDLVEALMPVADLLIDLLPIIKPLIEAWISMQETILKLVMPVIRGLVGLIKILASPLVAVAKILGGDGGGGGGGVNGAMSTLGSIVRFLAAPIQVFADAIGFLLTPLTKFSDTVSFLLGPLRLFSGIFHTVMSALPGIASSAFGLLKTVFSTSVTAITNTFSNQWDMLTRVTHSVLMSVGTNVSSWFGDLRGMFSTGTSAVRGIFSSGMGTLRGIASGAMSGVRSASSTGWGAVKGIFSSGVGGAKSLLRSGMAAMPGIISATTGGVKTAGDAVMGGLKSAISVGGGAAKSVLHSIVGTFAGIVSGASLVGAGESIMNGLASGIRKGIGAVTSVLHHVTDIIPLHKGPPKKDATLLYNAGVLIMTGLRNGLASQEGNVVKNLTSLTGLISKVTSGHLKKTLTAQAKQFKSLLGQYDKLADQIKSKQDKLNSLIADSNAMRDGIKNNLISAGDITGYTDADGKSLTSFSDIVKGLTDAKTKAAALANVLAKLKKAGLNKTSLDQIAEAGTTNGLAVAQSIQAAGAKGVQQINSLQGQLASSATSAGTTVADAFYKAGIQSTQGLIDGLKKQQGPLIASMKKLARQMVNELKKGLKIHSPSRVMHEIGGYTGKGLLNGLESTYDSVHKSIKKFASSITAADFGSPTLTLGAQVSALAGQAASPSTPGGDRYFNYYAAPGHSMPEEDVFKASQRARFGW